MTARRPLVWLAVAANVAVLVADDGPEYLHRAPPLTVPFVLTPDAPTFDAVVALSGNVYNLAVVPSVRAANADGAPPGGIEAYAVADEGTVPLAAAAGLDEADAGPASLAVTFEPVYVATPVEETGSSLVSLRLVLVGGAVLDGDLVVVAEGYAAAPAGHPVSASLVAP